MERVLLSGETSEAELGEDEVEVPVRPPTSSWERPPSSLRGPVPRRAKGRSRTIRVPPQAPGCTGTPRGMGGCDEPGLI